MAKRIIVGVLLAGLFVALLVFGGEFRMVVFSLAAIIAAYEMGKLFRAKGYKPWMAPLYVFGAVHYITIARFGYPLMLIIWFICIVAIAIERIFSKQRTTVDAMASLVIMVYPLMLFAALALVVSDNVRSTGAVLGMLLVFVCPLMGDTVAFFAGSFLGRHKLCPHISPKKTVEGSVGGFTGGALGGLLCYLLQPMWGLNGQLIPMLVVGLICGGIGQIGDLFASVIKRWAEVKDYGNIFPGHGGVMDRLDSVLMCAPIVLCYIYLV